MKQLTVTSPLLTSWEACEFLRLDDDHPSDKHTAIGALNRLVREGKRVRCARRVPGHQAKCPVH